MRTVTWIAVILLLPVAGADWSQPHVMHMSEGTTQVGAFSQSGDDVKLDLYPFTATLSDGYWTYNPGLCLEMHPCWWTTSADWPIRHQESLPARLHDERGKERIEAQAHLLSRGVTGEPGFFPSFAMVTYETPSGLVTTPWGPTGAGEGPWTIHSVAAGGDGLFVLAARTVDGHWNGHNTYLFIGQATPEGIATVHVQPDWPFSSAYNPMFGLGLAAEGDTIVASTPRYNPDGRNDAGSVLTLHRTATGWQEAGWLSYSGDRNVAAFGKSLALSDGQLLVGTPGVEVRHGDAIDAQPGRVRGAVIAYERDGAAWTERQMIWNCQTQPFNENYAASFGSHVRVRDDLMVVPGKYSERHGMGYGVGCLYERTGAVWNQVAALEPPGGAPAHEMVGHASIGPGMIALGGAHRGAYLFSQDAPASAPDELFQRPAGAGAPIALKDGHMVPVPRADGMDVWFVSGDSRGVVEAKLRLRTSDGPVEILDVACWNDKVAVSYSTGEDDQTNEVAIFERSTAGWTRHGTVRGLGEGPDWGQEIAIMDDWLAIGAAARPASYGDGSVHFYEYQAPNWVLDDVRGPPYQPGSPIVTGFGSNLEAFDDTGILVQSTGWDGHQRGSVHAVLLGPNGWTGPVVATSPLAAPEGTGFGRPMTVEGDLVHIGAPAARQIFTYEIQPDGTLLQQGTIATIDVGHLTALRGGTGSLLALSTSGADGFGKQAWLERFEQTPGEWRRSSILPLTSGSETSWTLAGPDGTTAWAGATIAPGQTPGPLPAMEARPTGMVDDPWSVSTSIDAAVAALMESIDAPGTNATAPDPTDAGSQVSVEGSEPSAATPLLMVLFGVGALAVQLRRRT